MLLASVAAAGTERHVPQNLRLPGNRRLLLGQQRRFSSSVQEGGHPAKQGESREQTLNTPMAPLLPTTLSHPPSRGRNISLSEEERLAQRRVEVRQMQTLREAPASFRSD